jgi:hypothetical protein
LLSFVITETSMQKHLFLLTLLFAGGTAFAQKKTADVKKTETAVVVAKEAAFVSFESVLADGKLYFTRSAFANGSGGSNTVYLIQNKANRNFNGGKPFEVKLSKDAFDTYFLKSSPELAQKWPQLVKYAQDKQLSFTDEQTWILVLKYYNSLPSEAN